MSNLLNLHETKIEINAAEINKSHCVKWPLGQFLLQKAYTGL